MKCNDRSASRSKSVTNDEHEMTPATAEMIIDMINVEDLLRLGGDREGSLLAAALTDFRRRLEERAGFVRPRPDHALACLKFIKIQRGNGWLKLIDTRVQKVKKRNGK